jgi:hypothetical protein
MKMIQVRRQMCLQRRSTVLRILWVSANDVTLHGHCWMGLVHVAFVTDLDDHSRLVSKIYQTGVNRTGENISNSVKAAKCKPCGWFTLGTYPLGSQLGRRYNGQSLWSLFLARIQLVSSLTKISPLDGHCVLKLNNVYFFEDVWTSILFRTSSWTILHAQPAVGLGQDGVAARRQAIGEQRQQSPEQRAHLRGAQIINK